MIRLKPLKRYKKGRNIIDDGIQDNGENSVVRALNVDDDSLKIMFCKISM